MAGRTSAITAEAVFAPLEDEKDLEKWKGKLKGKIVLAYPTREVKASFDPLATRYTETDLKKLEEVDPTASPRRNYNREGQRGFSGRSGRRHDVPERLRRASPVPARFRPNPGSRR